MVVPKSLKIGVFSRYPVLKNLDIYFREQDYFYSQLSLLVLEALHCSYQISYSNSGGKLLENGSWTGLIGLLNRSEIDLVIDGLVMTEDRNEAVHFAYPFTIDELTFMTEPPQYSPTFFGIFSSISSWIWITLGLFMIIVISLNYLFINGKCSLDKIILNILAICLKQPVNISASKMSVKWLLYPWMAGMTFFILCYNSVLLSFLTFPPVVNVSNITELAKAVQQGNYNCMIYEGSPFAHIFT